MTDQWNPAVAVNPSGTELFVGYYSRQVTGLNNHTHAYGAKANISNGLTGATFDTFQISQNYFDILYPGTDTSSPPADPWLFDNVWVQENVYFDANADVVTTSTPTRSANVYQHFCADDYTWATADASYFYYAWCDRSDTCTLHWSTNTYSRADPNIRLGKIKQ